MITPVWRFFPVLVGFLLLLPAAPTPAQQAAATPEGPQVLEVQGGKIRVVPVVTGLFHPWSLVLTDARTILVTERNGNLRMIRDGVLMPEPVWTSPTPPGEAADSLHFVAIHPKFAQNQLVYVSYPKQGERGITLAFARGRLSGAKLTDVREIFVADAWETGGNLAGRIYFTPDASLYVTVGDRDRICCNGADDNSLRMKAQRLDNDAGKTLRLRDDGTVPPDNPFVGRAGAKPEIFTYGHRNGYGLAVHPETGELWQAEIGPMGGDEVNILAAAITMAGLLYPWNATTPGRWFPSSRGRGAVWTIHGFSGFPRNAPSGATPPMEPS